MSAPNDTKAADNRRLTTVVRAARDAGVTLADIRAITDTLPQHGRTVDQIEDVIAKVQAKVTEKQSKPSPDELVQDDATTLPVADDPAPLIPEPQEQAPANSGKIKWALWLAANGFSIYPLPANSKAPAHGASWKLYATKDPAKIKEMFEVDPDANYLAAPDEDRNVLDLDMKDGKDGLAEFREYENTFGDLPDSFTVKTTTGGYHIYMAGSTPNSTGSLGPGIDVKGNYGGKAGYVVGPGSSIDGKFYTVEKDGPIAQAPDWYLMLARDAGKNAEPMAAPEGVVIDAPVSIYRATQRVRNLIALGDVAMQGSGGDNRTIRLACEMHDIALSPETALTVMAPWNEACQPRWEAEEFEAKVANGYQYAENEFGCQYVPPASEVFKGFKPLNDLHTVIPIPTRYRRAARFPGNQPRKGTGNNTEELDWQRALTTKREPLTEEEITELLSTHRYDKRRNASEREYAARFAFVAAGLRRGHAPQELYDAMVAHGNDRHMAGIKDADDPSHTLRTEIENVSRTLGDDLNKTVVRIIDGQEAQTVDKIEEAILTEAVPIFESDSVVVTPGEFSFKAHSRDVTTMRLIEITAASFANIVNRAIELQRYSKTEKAWLPVNCPDNIAKNFMQRHGGHILHPVAGITLVPVLREDGSILNEAGYDSSTGLIYEPCGVEFPEAKANPTKADAKLALDFLMDPLRLVPFATPAAKAVAASGFLSLLARRVIGNVPVHGIDATAPGSGKTLLVDCASVLATGEVAQPVVLAPNDEENTKTLAALLRQGSQLISYDNVTYPLGFAALESTVVSERPQARILGMTKTFTATNNSVIFANGNSFSVQGDMHRRTLVCRIDAQDEHPERRQFDFNPLDLYRDNRPAYVLAALTILRAYIVADKPDHPPRLGGFEGWSNLIRGALMWLGYADPVETQATIMEDNTDLVQLSYLLEQIEATNLHPITSQNVTKAITSAEAGPAQRALADAISNIASNKDGKVDMKALGMFLEKHKGRIVDGRRIEPDGHTHGTRRWKLVIRK